MKISSVGAEFGWTLQSGRYQEEENACLPRVESLLPIIHLGAKPTDLLRSILQVYA